MEFSYTAIILKSREVGETDRLYTLYTREGGKVQAIGRGVRKPRAKLAGHLETLNRGLVVINRSRGLGTITAAVAEWYGARIKRDAHVLGDALGVLRRFERVVGLAERDETLYTLLTEYLESLESQCGHLDDSGEGSVGIERGDGATGIIRQVLSQAFLFRVVGRLGYQVNVTHSVVTGEALRSGQRYGFSVAEGGMIEWEQIVDRTRTVAVSENALKLLRLYATQRIGSLPRVRLSAGVVHETDRILESLLHWIE